MDAVRAVAGRDGREYGPADLGPAVPAPARILCLGVNYSEHAIEGGRAVPTWPEAFVRGRDSVLGPYADLVKPALTERFDYEGELGVVIGAGGRYIPADKALDAIAGFVVLNDASARDWQRAGTQWTAGKNFEGSMPIGPEVVTTDEADMTDALLTTVLNGQVMQSARTSQMIVDIPSAVEFFSSFTRLAPGRRHRHRHARRRRLRPAAPGLAHPRRRHRGHHRGPRHHPQPRGRRARRPDRLALASRRHRQARALSAKARRGSSPRSPSERTCGGTMKFTSLATGRRRRAWVLAAAITAAALAALTGCSSSSSTPRAPAASARSRRASLGQRRRRRPADRIAAHRRRRRAVQRP